MKEIKAFSEFQTDMARKLYENRYKGGWSECTLDYLRKRLEQEVGELQDVINTLNKEEIINECADVANFCMMIADNFRNNRYKNG